jgi:hypothetical protein
MLQPAANSHIPFDAIWLDQLMEAASVDGLIATSKHNVQYRIAKVGRPVRKNSQPISNGTEPQAWLRMSPLRRNTSSFATRIPAGARASSP